MNWLWQNRQWLFSGLGVTIIVGLGYLARYFFVRRRPTRKLMVERQSVASSPNALQLVNTAPVILSLSNGRGASTDRINERQVEALGEIQSKLEYALFYLQRATSAGKLQGEPDENELLRRMAVELGAASECLSKNRLILDENVIRQIDAFLKKVVLTQVDVELALHPMTPDGTQRAKFWDSSRIAAHKELPQILEALRAEARAAIRR